MPVSRRRFSQPSCSSDCGAASRPHTERQFQPRRRHTPSTVAATGSRAIRKYENVSISMSLNHLRGSEGFSLSRRIRVPRTVRRKSVLEFRGGFLFSREGCSLISSDHASPRDVVVLRMFFTVAYTYSWPTADRHPYTSIVDVILYRNGLFHQSEINCPRAVYIYISVSFLDSKRSAGSNGFTMVLIRIIFFSRYSKSNNTSNMNLLLDIHITLPHT